MMFLDKQNRALYQSWLDSALTEGSVALIDKAADWTSFDVVAKLRSLTKIKKVGHAGTLDPFATGLLIVCFGKATKTIEDYQNLPKEYKAVMKLGATTKTDDFTAEEENIKGTDLLVIDSIQNLTKEFTGTITQTPPQYSAKKISGRRAYELARKNKEFKIEPVEVNIFKFEILNINLPYIEFIVACSKGTYIRAIARDFGEKLGCGGYLTELRRTSIGDYKAENALNINEMIEISQVQ